MTRTRAASEPTPMTTIGSQAWASEVGEAGEAPGRVDELGR